MKTDYNIKPFVKQKGYTIGVKFSKTQLEQIKNYCDKNFISQTNLIRLAVAKYLQENE